MNMFEARSNPEKPLTETQIKFLNKFMGYFGGPDDFGHLLIPTGFAYMEPTPTNPFPKSPRRLDDNGERMITEAQSLGLFDMLTDRRQEEGGAGAFGDIIIEGDPEGGVSIIFSDAVLHYLIDKRDN